MTSGKLALQLANRRLDSGLARAGLSGSDLSGHLQPVQGLLRQVAGSLARLDHLIDDLADVSRIREGSLSLHLASCDVADPVREAVEEARRFAPERAIHLDSPSRRSPRVLADGDAFGRS